MAGGVQKDIPIDILPYPHPLVDKVIDVGCQHTVGICDSQRNP